MVCWEVNPERLKRAADNAEKTIDELRKELEDTQKQHGHETAERKFEDYLKMSKKKKKEVAKAYA